ncbi:hypothetical protein PG994_003820 [Apiospora phragmitis]|uniref:Uncharacterized protein n=1 Tax=Apiospora phragmitis TaxID=2905665 RepID=A0ABR1W325_9PEZI
MVNVSERKKKKGHKRETHAKTMAGIPYGQYLFNEKMAMLFNGDMEKAAEQQKAELGVSKTGEENESKEEKKEQK